MNAVRHVSANTRWPFVVPLSWFVLVIVASGLFSLAQDLVGLASVPVSQAALALLVVLAIVTLAAPRANRAPMLPGSLRAAVACTCLAGIVAFFVAIGSGTPADDSVAAFVFVYGIAMAGGVAAVAPVRARFGGALFLLFTGAVALGIAQILTQKLLLPTAFVDDLGLLYQDFVNGRVRAIAFFPSPPRFAELIVLGSLITLHHILVAANIRWRGLLLLGVLVLVLYNTYSRSGYVLLVVTAACLLVMVRSSVRGGRGFGIGATYALVVSAVAVVIAFWFRWLPLDDSVADTRSLEARQGHWGVLLDRLRELDLVGFMFGAGEAARFAVADSRYFVVDNLYLAIFLYSGIVGLVSFVVLAVATIRLGLRLRREHGVSIEPLLAFTMGLLVEGFFVDNHNTAFLALLALLGIMNRVIAEEPRIDPDANISSFASAGSPSHGIANLTKGSR